MAKCQPESICIFKFLDVSFKTLPMATLFRKRDREWCWGMSNSEIFPTVKHFPSLIWNVMANISDASHGSGSVVKPRSKLNHFRQLNLVWGFSYQWVVRGFVYEGCIWSARSKNVHMYFKQFLKTVLLYFCCKQSSMFCHLPLVSLLTACCVTVKTGLKWAKLISPAIWSTLIWTRAAGHFVSSGSLTRAAFIAQIATSVSWLTFTEQCH